MQKTAGKNTKYWRNETILKIGHLAKAIAHAKVITTTTTTVEGVSQHRLENHGWLLSSVTESSISSKGVYVSGCWSSPAAGTVFRFPEDEI